MSYEKQQAAWLKKTKLKIGDKVAVIATATQEQSGWENNWIEAAMPCPDTGVLVGMHDEQAAKGLQIRSDTTNIALGYPFWVLVKLEDK